MLIESIRILSTTMKSFEQESGILEVTRFFDIAVLCGSIEATVLDDDNLEFILAGTDKIVHQGFGHQLRFILGQIGLNVDEIRYPELEKPFEFTEEEVAQEATRLGIPVYLPEDEQEDFHARFVREQTGKKIPPRRLGQVYANLSTRRRLEQKQRGIERVNKYGFELTINYPYGATAVVPLYVKVANDRMNPPFYFCIRRIADN